MAKKRRVGRYPLEFRRMAVERMCSSDNISALAEELRIDRDLLYRWRGQFEATLQLRHGPASRRQKIRAIRGSEKRTVC